MTGIHFFHNEECWHINGLLHLPVSRWQFTAVLTSDQIFSFFPPFFFIKQSLCYRWIDCILLTGFQYIANMWRQLKGSHRLNVILHLTDHERLHIVQDAVLKKVIAQTQACVNLHLIGQNYLMHLYFIVSWQYHFNTNKRRKKWVVEMMWHWLHVFRLLKS